MNAYPTIYPFSLLHTPHPFPLQSHFHIDDSFHNFNFLPPPSMSGLSLTSDSSKMGSTLDFLSMTSLLHIQLHYILDCSSEMHIRNTHSMYSHVPDPLIRICTTWKCDPSLPSSLLLSLTLSTEWHAKFSSYSKFCSEWLNLRLSATASPPLFWMELSLRLQNDNACTLYWMYWNVCLRVYWMANNMGSGA